MPMSQFTFDWYKEQLNAIKDAKSVDMCEKLMRLFNSNIRKDVHLKYSERQELLELAKNQEWRCLERLWRAEEASRKSPPMAQPARWLRDLLRHRGLGLYRSKGVRPRTGGRRENLK